MRRLTYIFLVLMIVFVQCYQTKNTVTPVMIGDAPTPDTEQSITFDNVLDLEVGKRYRMRPTSYIQSLAGVWHAHKISELFFSNVRDRLTRNPPAVEARFILNPAPYMLKSEREFVINDVSSRTGSRVYDEIIIEIKQKKEHGKKRGFRYVIYEAVAIENLTNPDFKFEYE